MAETNREQLTPPIKILDQVVIPERGISRYGLVGWEISKVKVTLPDPNQPEIIVYTKKPIFMEPQHKFNEQNPRKLALQIQTLSEEFSKLPSEKQEKLRAEYQEARSNITRLLYPNKYDPLFEQEELRRQFEERKKEIEEEIK